MKKELLSYLVAFFLSILVTKNARTQNSNSTAKVNRPLTQIFTFPRGSNEERNTAYLNNINTRVARHFDRDFKDVFDAIWVQYEKGYIVSFNRDSVHIRVYYTKRGDTEMVIRYYFENRLSKDIRRLVRSRYFDYGIYQVSETKANDIITYYIKIQDKTAWKTLMVLNGEIEILQEYYESAPR